MKALAQKLLELLVPEEKGRKDFDTLNRTSHAQPQHLRA